MYQGQVSVEELLTQFISLIQTDTETKFTQGAIAEVLTDMGLSASQLANEANCSAALIRELIKTFRAFPTEEDRAPYAQLSHYHFRLAAGTSDPHYWIGIAADRDLSTRELSKLIKGETVKDELREIEKTWAKVEKTLDNEGAAKNWVTLKIVHTARLLTGGAYE